MLVEARDAHSGGPRKKAEPAEHAPQRNAGPAGDAQEAEVCRPRVPRALQDVSALVLRLTPQGRRLQVRRRLDQPAHADLPIARGGKRIRATGADEEPVLRNGQRFRRESGQVQRPPPAQTGADRLVHREGSFVGEGDRSQQRRGGRASGGAEPRRDRGGGGGFEEAPARGR
jgi:hypothetical protein